MLIYSRRSPTGDTLQGQLFDKIVNVFAKQHDLPTMAAYGNAVLEQIELAVESFLLRDICPAPDLSPEIMAMAELWRKLESDARSRRMIIWATQMVPFPAPMAV